MRLTRYDFRVMASRTEVILVGARAGAGAQAERRLRQLEARWSRFLESSELTRLNQAQGSWVSVSDDTIRLVETMKLGSLATGGGYDPTRLHRLLELGYTGSIDDASLTTIAVGRRNEISDIHDVEIDHRRHRVRIPSGLALDPGGIGKGLAADFVVVELLEAGTAGALVSVGGDIAAAGAAPIPDGWLVDIEDPVDPPDVITTLAVRAGGVATSSTRSRRWTQAGMPRHHVLDPVTDDMSTTDLAAMTVVARAGWLAEVHATAAILRGAAGALEHLDAHGLSGLAIERNGTVHGSPDLALLPTLPAGAPA